MIRRTLTVLTLSAVFFVLVAPAVGGHPNQPPVVTVAEWQDPPVVVVPRDCNGHCTPEILIVEVVDPDSSISEVQVTWASGAVFAHTGCVQGIAPGIPARLLIPIEFRHKGIFTVDIVASSQLGCDFRKPVEISETFHLVTVVRGLQPGLD